MSRSRARDQAEQAAAPRIAVVYRPIDQLKLDSNNPRLHSRKQVRKIARSVEQFGFVVPILTNADLKVIAGHGRVMAARMLDWGEVPTISLDHLSEAQARALLLAENRLAEEATWDKQLLGQQLNELAALDLDFSLELTGFEMGEIDLLIEGLNSTEVKPDPADELPVAHGPSVCRLGDLWRLAGHKIYCGSALNATDYAHLLGDEKAAMVMADPPYNVPIQGNVSGLGSIQHREFVMASGEMSKVEFTNFLTRVCSLFSLHSVEGSLHFIFMDWRHLEELLLAGGQTYGELKNLCVWVKDAPGMGSLYRSQHELVLVFKHGCEAHRNNVELGRYGRNRTNIWNYPSVSSFGRSGEEGKLLALHPTVKPVALIADAILDCSTRGDIVLDGFLGSGTTVIAAERTGRCCRGLELDPVYVDTTIRRWQAYTGESARHVASGQTFNEIAAAAEQGE
jgi:hypothetical protein